MKVILLSDLHRVGRRGDVIAAKPGYARNYLIPEGLAVQASHGNLKWFEGQKKKIDERAGRERESAAELATRLDGTSITVRKRAGESQTLYGSVTATEIAAASISRAASRHSASTRCGSRCTPRWSPR
jgi:large subunit ribosomal protein L9